VHQVVRDVDAFECSRDRGLVRRVGRDRSDPRGLARIAASRDREHLGVLCEGGHERTSDETCRAEHGDFHPVPPAISRRK
jgi:hypothetical protein